MYRKSMSRNKSGMRLFFYKMPVLQYFGEEAKVHDNYN
jgi:hypothetical protein